MRGKLRLLLAHDYDIVGEASDGAGALTAARELQPDVLLLDISMPVMNGFAVARQLVKEENPAKILFVTHHSEPAYVNEARDAGAHGYVLKATADLDLPPAILSAGQSGFYLSPCLASS